jgi:WD40 repeat protein
MLTARFPLLSLLAALLLVALPAHAQEGFPLPPLEVITPENADEIVQLARIGNGVINEMAWSPDGVTLGIASSLGVWLYNTEQPAAPPRLFEGQDGAQSLAFNPNGRYIASGGVDGSVWIWDIESGEVVARLEGHLYTISTIEFSPDGSVLATVDSSIVRLWNAMDWSERAVLENDHRIESIAFNPEGTLLAVNTCSEVSIWQVETGQFLKDDNGALILASSGSCGTQLAFENESRLTIVTRTFDETEIGHQTWLWDVELDEEPQPRFQIRWYEVRNFLNMYSLNGQVYGVGESGDVNPQIVQMNLSMGGRIVDYIGYSPEFGLIGFDGGTNLAIWDSEKLSIVQVETNEEYLLSRLFVDDVQSINFNSLGTILLSGNVGNALIWSLNTGQLIYEIDDLNALNLYSDVDLSADGRLLSSGGTNSTITVYHAESGEEYARLFGHMRGVSSVAFSPDSALVASAGLDNLIGVWDIRTGGEIAPLVMLEGHNLGATAVAFSSDGRLIASGSYDGTIRLWGIPAGS